MLASLPAKPEKINRRLQLALAVLGTTALCCYWKSWKDLPHLVYDMPSGFAMSAFIAQLICERQASLVSARWWGRLIAMIPISIVPLGREFCRWPVSGHLTDMLALAMIQALDEELPMWERIAYVFPLPTVLSLRFLCFDVEGHRESLNAIIAGIAIYLVAKFGGECVNWISSRHRDCQ
jgi:hypothetical protein